MQEKSLKALHDGSTLLKGLIRHSHKLIVTRTIQLLVQSNGVANGAKRNKSYFLIKHAIYE